MATKISFADLTHTGQIVAANTFPFGISMVAAYLKSKEGAGVDMQIFKYPEDLSNYLDGDMPAIACFSAFAWNVRLGHEFAKRIQQVSPKTVVVFGGPNFPGSAEEQKEFLESFPAIDGYIEFEGEKSFHALYLALQELDFDWTEFKRRRLKTPNLRYLADGEFVLCDMGDKTKDLNELPSPYQMGLMDKFFDDKLIPLLQSTRGCPYSCAFCWEGGDYFQRVSRLSQERIYADMNYISDRVKVPDLLFADANFGMFPGDIDTAKEIKRLQDAKGWPQTVLVATAKNHKERTVEIVNMLGNTMPPTAAVQSTDEQVLANIGRKNVPMPVLEMLAKAVEKVGGQTEAELILCLEGDTKEKHFKTVMDMLGANMTFIRMYQFMMLPGTQSAGKASREKYGFRTRYRVLPRCFGLYRFRAESFPAAEIEEIVIEHKTMPYEDYQTCRVLHLMVEIFNNDSIFADLSNFLRFKGVSRPAFISAILEKFKADPVLSKIVEDYKAEEKKNMWDDPAEVAAFTMEPGVIQKYISAEYGTNELYKYRVVATFHHLEAIHRLAYSVAKQLMKANGTLAEDDVFYLDELYEFSLLRKLDPLNRDKVAEGRFHFDFVKLQESHFLRNPFDLRLKEPMTIKLFHTQAQKDMIQQYYNQYGSDIIGLSRIVLRANMNRLYRSSTAVEGAKTGAVLHRYFTLGA
ncbi:MAG: hypothetical protein HY403_07095 [Elusimicrobia bacterium]|nr:hypothetical protein [Elusimicrobiota bacterium]